MTRARTIAAAVAGALAIASLAAGGVLVYLRAQVLDQDAFERRALVAVEQPAVRRAIADRIVTELIGRGDPDLVTARPLLVTAVQSVIASAPFRSVLRIAAGDAHSLLFARRRDQARVELANLASILVSAVRSVDPRLARQLPRSLDVRLASLTVAELGAGAPRTADALRGAADWLVGAGLLFLMASLALARERRRAVIWLCTGAMAAAAAVLVVAGARPRAGGSIGQLSRTQTDDAFAEAWWAFAGDLRTWAFVTAGCALLVMLVTAWQAPLPAHWRQTLAAGLTRPAVEPWRRAVRAIVALGVAAAIAAASGSAARPIALALAVLLVLVAADEIVGPRPHRIARDIVLREPRARRRAALALTVTAAAAGIGLGVLALTRQAREIPLGATAGSVGSGRSGCNGSLPLCERRINEVLFPGTHNSMSAIERRGWVFTNQRYDVPHQLREGVRLLLLDAHWGAGMALRSARILRARAVRAIARCGHWAPSVRGPSSASPARSGSETPRAGTRSSCATRSVSWAPHRWPRRSPSCGSSSTPTRRSC